MRSFVFLLTFNNLTQLLSDCIKHVVAHFAPFFTISVGVNHFVFSIFHIRKHVEKYGEKHEKPPGNFCKTQILFYLLTNWLAYLYG